MNDDTESREAALKQSLDHNLFLTRELHHRLKNSLQIIQSYLALSRRQHTGVERVYLAETEAKVQVLSTAYRMALNGVEMQLVMIKPFAEEIIGRISSSMRQSGQWIDVRIDLDAALVVDRIIPFGLALVEATIAALRAVGTTVVSIIVSQCADGWISLHVSTNGTPVAGLPSPKIVAGLSAQLVASVEAIAPNDILVWRFKP